MPTVPGPIIPRKRLGTHLRELRERNNLTLEEVAEALMISTSKLSRLENAQGSPQPRDVRDLVRHYQVEKPEADRLMRWVRDARKQGWWNDYEYDSTGFASGLDSHVAYESEADVARVYTIPFVPALLQTEAYARRLYSSMEPWRGAGDIEQLVKLRVERQKVLNEREPEPLHLTAVMHETALRQLVGTPDIMREQLEYLLGRTKDKHIELRILPFTALPVFTSTCMWAHFEFGDSLDRDVVHVETHAGFRYIETPDQVRQYQRHFSELWRRALNDQDTRQMLESAVGDW